MTDDHPSELDVLSEQLDELLIAGTPHPDDALELAIVAGLAWRLGADPSLLDAAEAWRESIGHTLLDEAFDALDPAEITERLEELAGPDSDESEIEEALSDFDDLVAAAAWARRTTKIRPAAGRIATLVRTIPESFAHLAWDGQLMARTRVVAEDPELYDYWMAVADAGEWADDG